MSPDPPADPAGTPRSAHDPAGGELARAIARAYRGAGRKRSGRSSSRRRSVDPTLSSSHADDRDPQPLQASMSRLVAEHGWSTEIAVHGLFGRWDTIVGTEVAAHCRPERYVDGRLWVRADSTAWATEVRLLAPVVVQRLNDELGEGTVSRIDVAGPQQPSWRHGRFTVRDGRGPRDTYG